MLTRHPKYPILHLQTHRRRNLRTALAYPAPMKGKGTAPTRSNVHLEALLPKVFLNVSNRRITRPPGLGYGATCVH